MSDNAQLGTNINQNRSTKGFLILRFRIRTLLIVAALVAVVAFGVGTVIGTMNTIRNAYAVWWVGDMVVEHLDANNNQWPQSWEDLADDYDTCVANAGASPWQFEELKSRVRVTGTPTQTISFHANPVANPTSRLSGSPTAPLAVGQMPNQIRLY